MNGPSLGLATSYQLTGPIGVAVDRAGDIYFTDANRVLVVDRATQQLEVVAGTGSSGFSGDGGPGPQAMLNGPSGVAVAPNGDVYVEDGNRVRKVSAADGIISTVAGDGRTGSSGNGGPAVRASLDFANTGHGVGGLSDSIALGPDGALYLAETGNNEVQKVSLATGVITTVVGPGIHCGPLDGICLTAPHPCAPVGVAVDSSSNLFVATGCGSIRQSVAATGVTSTIFFTRQDPALAGTGRCARPDWTGGRQRQDAVRDGGLRPAPAGAQPCQRAGRARRRHRRRDIPEPGQTAGDGGPASDATFGLALGTAIDGQGNVYVADFDNDAIRMIDGRTGVISTVAGQIPMSPEQQGHCC